MDNSASELELAEELQATRLRVQELELQIDDLSNRISNLASQLGKLTKVVKQMMTSGMAQAQGETASAQNAAGFGDNTAPARSNDPGPAPTSSDIPSELLQVIRLITENKSDEAQKLVTTLPRDMLLANQGIVALVAGSVRIRKGEFDVASAALQKARNLITDPKLLRVVKFLENQLPG